MSTARTQTCSADEFVMLGVEQHRKGLIAEASALYIKALAANPKHSDALNLSGAISFSTGKYSEAIRLISKAVEANPGNLDAYLNLAEAQDVAGKSKDSLSTCRKVLAIAPDHAEARARLALLLAKRGESPLALRHAKVALAMDPDAVEALYAQGLAFDALGQSVQAKAAYQRALETAPDDLRIISGFAAMLRLAGAIEETLPLYRRALTLQPSNPEAMAAVASASELNGDMATAIELFQRALSIAPESVPIRFSYARCLRDTGAFESAVEQFSDVLGKDPGHAPALLALVRMKKLKDTAEQRRSLEILSRTPNGKPRNQIQAQFALGEMLDRAGECDAAFKHFESANRLYRKFRASSDQEFDRYELLDLYRRLEEGLARDYALKTSGWGNPSDLPVFVVGLPRSGTTLVEQICASHSMVAGLGELRTIQRSAKMISDHNFGRADIADWDSAFSKKISSDIVSKFAETGKGFRRAIDKTPLNLMRLGMISALLPNARIIRCHRDARDIAISNFTMYYSHGNTFSTNLGDCGFAIKNIRKVGDIWQEHLGLQVLDVVYEDLVSDLEVNTRRMIEFLGLPWEDGCLQFHQTDRHVDTPSSWQVRQPIYTNSIERWRRFENHLQPLFDELR